MKKARWYVESKNSAVAKRIERAAYLIVDRQLKETWYVKEILGNKVTLIKLNEVTKHIDISDLEQYDI